MIYTVRPGDSLWSIASTLCRNPYLWRQIADDNHIRGSTILVGQSLVVSDALCSRRAAGALSGMVASGGQSVAGGARFAAQWLRPLLIKLRLRLSACHLLRR